MPLDLISICRHASLESDEMRCGVCKRLQASHAFVVLWALGVMTSVGVYILRLRVASGTHVN